MCYPLSILPLSNKSEISPLVHNRSVTNLLGTAVSTVSAFAEDLNRDLNRDLNQDLNRDLNHR